MSRPTVPHCKDCRYLHSIGVYGTRGHCRSNHFCKLKHMMNDWLTWFISLIRTAVNWMSQMYIFDVSLIAIIVAIFLMGVTLRALLYKA